MKNQRGDVAILIVTMMVIIMSFIVIATSQSTLRSLVINRKGVGSQQAVQMANIGIERWLISLREGVFDDIPLTAFYSDGFQCNFPTECVTDPSAVGRYEVEYDPLTRTLLSRGYVSLRGVDEVVRALEVQF